MKELIAVYFTLEISTGFVVDFFVEVSGFVIDILPEILVVLQKGFIVFVVTSGFSVVNTVRLVVEDLFGVVNKFHLNDRVEKVQESENLVVS